MGADLMFYILEMPLGKEPDWKAAEKHIEEADLPARLGIVANEEIVEEHREKLREHLGELKSWWNEKGKRDVFKVDLEYTEAIITGGMSWGDDPTDAYSILDNLDDAGVLHALGFFRKKETPEDDAIDLLGGAKRVLEKHADGYPGTIEKLDSIIKALELKSR